jgi:hypothetical protein
MTIVINILQEFWSGHPKMGAEKLLRKALASFCCAYNQIMPFIDIPLTLYENGEIFL